MSAKENNIDKFFFDKEKKRFHKIPSQLMFDSELEMSLRARKLSEQSGLFYVPKIIEYTKDELIFELLDNNTSLRSYFIQATKLIGTPRSRVDEMKKVFFNVGQVLGTIHSNNNIFTGIVKRELEVKFKGSDDDNVYLHGDFSMTNVLFDSTSDRVTIIDWSVSHLFLSPANFGSRYWDLTFFISTLFYASISTYYSYKIRETLAKDFLMGYLEITQLDISSFSQVLGQFMRQFNTYKLYSEMTEIKVGGLKKVLWGRSELKLKSFSKRIEQVLTEC